MEFQAVLRVSLSLEGGEIPNFIDKRLCGHLGFSEEIKSDRADSN